MKVLKKLSIYSILQFLSYLVEGKACTGRNGTAPPAYHTVGTALEGERAWLPQSLLSSLQDGGLGVPRSPPLAFKQ